MKKTISLFASVLVSAVAIAQNEVVKIYDGPAPGSESWTHQEYTIDYWSSIWNEWNQCVYNVVEPSLSVYLPAEGSATGTAVIVAPGGGYEALSWNNEGSQVGAWLAHHGITAFVLKYRTAYAGADFDQVNMIAQANYGGAPVTDEVKALREKNRAVASSMGNIDKMAGDDGRQAISYVRKNAARYGVDPHKIGIIGFSAGGWVVNDVLCNHDDNSRPDFVGMMYGTHRYKTAPEDPMPAFIGATQYEILGGATKMYEDWCKARVPAEIHSFALSRHGFGYRDNNTGEDLWVEMFLNFLRKTGFVR